MKKLSIIVPCYNEALNVPLILNRFSEVLKRDDIEVILVNNGSTDDSATVLAELLPNYSFARTVTVPVNQGYGFGILSGLQAATGDYIGWTHADLQTDPEDVVKALNLIEAQGSPTDIFVKGKRKGRGWFDNFFTVGMSIFETIYLRMGLWEVNAQPTIFPARFFQTWDNPPHDFALDLYAYFMAKRKKYRVFRIPVLFPERIHGTSHWNTSVKMKIKFIKRTMNFSRKLKKVL